MDLNLWIVTGWRGSGKTTFCQALVQTARQHGWDAAGLLSPAVCEDGIKQSILAEDIRTGEKQGLAAAQPQSPTDLAFGDWFFNRNTIEWGNRVLQSSLPCDLWVVDELGPLEFNLSMGWVSALEVIQSAHFRLGLVVIRPELLEQAQNLLHPRHTIEISRVNQVQNTILEYNPWLTQLKGSA